MGMREGGRTTKHEALLRVNRREGGRDSTNSEWKGRSVVSGQWVGMRGGGGGWGGGVEGIIQNSPVNTDL